MYNNPQFFSVISKNFFSKINLLEYKVGKPARGKTLESRNGNQLGYNVQLLTTFLKLIL
jgi:hypothetical protein